MTLEEALQLFGERTPVLPKLVKYHIPKHGCILGLCVGHMLMSQCAPAVALRQT